jgi:hypothetical protein
MIIESCQEYVPLVHELNGCYKWYHSRPLRFHRRVWVRDSGIWRMAHVGPEGVCGLGIQVYGAWRMWAQSGHTVWHMTTLDTQTWLRGEVPALGLTDEDVGLLMRVDCDILAPGMVISWPKT